MNFEFGLFINMIVFCEDDEVKLEEGLNGFVYGYKFVDNGLIDVMM